MAAISTSSRKHDDERNHEDQNDDVTRDLLLHVKSLTLSGNQQPRLLIFDLNGLLIHRAHKYFKKTSDYPANRLPDAVVGNHLVYRRPFCKEFITFCLKKFEVAIWSSAMEGNMGGVMDLVFSTELSSKILFIWSQFSCSDYGFKSPEEEKPMYFKELHKVWESRERWSKGSFSATNTLLVDNKPYKGLLNPPNTGIFPNSYDPENANDNALDLEGELRLYLKGLVEAEGDVPSYVASHPFGQPAIKEGHPKWSFYYSGPNQQV